MTRKSECSTLRYTHRAEPAPATNDTLTQTYKLEKEIDAHSRKVNDVVAGQNFVYSSSDDRAVSAWQTDTYTRVCKVLLD